jgi:septum formation protein
VAAVTARPGCRIVLASASPARLATLRAAGLHPVVRVSSVDEAAVLARTGITDAEAVPLLLARAKAEDVAAALDESEDDDSEGESGWIVIGCDSVLDLDSVALGRPADAEAAIRQWRRMRGRTGLLRTGHWLIDLRPDDAGGTRGAVGGSSVTAVHFADVADAEIEAYVATGEPLQVAGAFSIDGLGGAFISGIEGDHHGVVGVSLPLLRELLAQFGVRWTDLWTTAHPTDLRRPGLPAR